MVDFVQHPHILKYQLKLGSDSYQDSKGNWITPSATTVDKEFICRAVPNKKGEEVIGADGVKVYFDFLIYAPPGIEMIPYKTNVAIHNDGALIGSGTVKRMFIGQLNSKVWV